MGKSNTDELTSSNFGNLGAKHLRVSKSLASIYAALLFGLSIFLIFWLLPLANLGSITTPHQDPGYSDSNFYLYSALQNCGLPASQRDYRVTWSSQGIVAYLTYSCLLTGSYLGFIIVNMFLIFFSYYYYINSFRKYLFGSGIIVANALSIYTFALLLSPGKEIISFVGLCFISGSVIRIESAGSLIANSKNLFMFILGLIVTASNRLHEAVVLVVAIGAYIMYRKLGVKFLMIYVTVLLLFIDIAAQYLLGIDIGSLIFFGDEDEADLSLKLSKALISENSFINALLSPLRIISVPFGSFLQLVSDRTIHNDYYFMYRDILQRFRAIDMAVFLIALYCAFKWRREPVFFAAVITIVSLSAITWTGILEKSRYYFVYIPLLTPFISIRHRILP